MPRERDSFPGVWDCRASEYAGPLGSLQIEEEDPLGNSQGQVVMLGTLVAVRLHLRASSMAYIMTLHAKQGSLKHFL